VAFDQCVSSTLEIQSTTQGGTLEIQVLPKGEMFDIVFPMETSAMWRGIAHGLELLKKGIIWQVKSRNKIPDLEGLLDSEAIVLQTEPQEGKITSPLGVTANVNTTGQIVPLSL
jgi:hypothetical protein